MNIETIQVKITKVSKSSFWYAKEINKKYDVYINDGLKEDYVLKEDYDKKDAEIFRMIKKEDCEIISYETKKDLFELALDERDALRINNSKLKEKLELATGALKKVGKTGILWEAHVIADNAILEIERKEE